MIHKEHTDNETLIYMNGSLLYKIWHGVKRASVLFEKYGKPTRNTDRDHRAIMPTQGEPHE